MRREFEMTNKQFEDLLRASQPVPYMVFGGHPPTSPQESANQAWANLGKKMGFDPMTAKPIHGKPQTCFTAEPIK